MTRDQNTRRGTGTINVRGSKYFTRLLRFSDSRKKIIENYPARIIGLKKVLGNHRISKGTIGKYLSDDKFIN